jgi:hypothetical protein
MYLPSPRKVLATNLTNLANLPFSGSQPGGASITTPRIRQPHIPLATLFERRARDNRTYLVGRIGNARVIAVRTERRSRGDVVWELVIAPGPTEVHDAEGLLAQVQELNAEDAAV